MAKVNDMSYTMIILPMEYATTKVYETLAKPVEFGNLAMTAIRDCDGLVKLIEAGASPWQLFNCPFAARFSFVDFIETALTLMEMHTYHYRRELAMLPKASGGLTELREQADKEMEKLCMILDEYKLSALINMEGHITAAITYFPAIFKLSPEKCRSSLLAERSFSYDDYKTMSNVKCNTSIIISLSQSCVANKSFAGCLLSSIHNINAQFDAQLAQDYILQPGAHSDAYVDALSVFFNDYLYAKESLRLHPEHKDALAAVEKTTENDPLIYMAMCEVFCSLDDAKYASIRQFIYNYDVHLLQSSTVKELDLQSVQCIAQALSQPITLDSAKLAQFKIVIPNNQISLLQLMRRLNIVQAETLSELEVLVAKAANPELISAEQSKNIEAVSEGMMQKVNQEDFIKTLSSINDYKLFATPLCTALSLQQCDIYLSLLNSKGNELVNTEKANAINMGNLSLNSMAFSLKDQSYIQSMTAHMFKLLQEKAAQSQEKERQ